MPNVANTLMLVGFAVLGVMLFFPSYLAERVARIESRAVDTARILHDLALEESPIDLHDQDRMQSFGTEFRRRCEEFGLPTSYLPEPSEVALSWLDEAFCFETRRYMYMVTRQPPPARELPGYDPQARRPLEIYAWPRTLRPPGRSAFFLPESGPTAFSRNLSADYEGWENPPRPGRGQPREDPGETRRWHYRGLDDERWILLPTNPG